MKTCTRCHAYPYKDGPCFASDCPQAAKMPAPHGLFEGLLDDLLSQQRHAARHLELMSEVAREEPLDREKIGRVIEEAIHSSARYQKSCADFIDKFGTRLVLKESA